MTDIYSYKLDYKFQEKDIRDHVFDQHPELDNSFILKTQKSTDIIVLKDNLPSKFNLYRANLIEQINILDQKNIGSCVANAFALNISYIRKNNNDHNLSRLLLYALSRIHDRISLSEDGGSTIRSAGYSIAKYGICPEKIHPYNSVNIANYKLLPPLIAFKNSNQFKTFSYTFIKQGINYLKNIQSVLNTYNSPIIFGFNVYDSFMNVTKNGGVPMPDLKKEKIQGGHCMNIIGYVDENKMFICANSWGTEWGANGFCYMPYEYILNPRLAGDLCFLQLSV
jgi:C1A family cysteine protease